LNRCSKRHLRVNGSDEFLCTCRQHNTFRLVRSNASSTSSPPRLGPICRSHCRQIGEL
jgi:hypothetical protein